MSLTEARIGYKPFSYPWAYEAWKMQQSMHWLPEEVPMADDVRQWNKELTSNEKHLLTQIFRFFTQADIEVNDCYMRHYMSVFKPTEILMMLAAFSNAETIHIAAYSHLIDTIGLPESEYSTFMEYDAMKAKRDFTSKFDHDDAYSVALTMAVFGGFIEGLQLFASFAMLLNFPRFGKMKGMGQIITWSVRDETLHCNSIIKLYHEWLNENPAIDVPMLKDEIVDMCREAVHQEDKFIDLAFEMGSIEGMTANEVKSYIRYIANKRLAQFYIPSIFGVHQNPLPWIDDMLNGVEFANFFEIRATDYSRAATKGTWEDVFNKFF